MSGLDAGESYGLDNLHYNSRGVVQISAEENFQDLAGTLRAVEETLRAGSQLEQNMLSFFKREVEPLAAYKDNDVTQGKEGPRRLHAVGRLRRLNEDNGLFVRLGISAPGENLLIPVFQALYLQSNVHMKYFMGMPIGPEEDPDRWVYEFSERYLGMVEGVKVRTRLGIHSLLAIPAINEALLNGVPFTDLKPQLEAPKLLLEVS